jgi:hypothetical protein
MDLTVLCIPYGITNTFRLHNLPELLERLSLVKAKELNTYYIQRLIRIVVYVWMLRMCT